MPNKCIIRVMYIVFLIPVFLLFGLLFYSGVNIINIILSSVALVSMIMLLESTISKTLKH